MSVTPWSSGTCFLCSGPPTQPGKPGSQSSPPGLCVPQGQVTALGRGPVAGGPLGHHPPQLLSSAFSSVKLGAVTVRPGDISGKTLPNGEGALTTPPGSAPLSHAWMLAADAGCRPRPRPRPHCCQVSLPFRSAWPPGLAQTHPASPPPCPAPGPAASPLRAPCLPGGGGGGRPGVSSIPVSDTGRQSADRLQRPAAPPHLGRRPSSAPAPQPRPAPGPREGLSLPCPPENCPSTLRCHPSWYLPHHRYRRPRRQQECDALVLGNLLPGSSHTCAPCPPAPPPHTQAGPFPGPRGSTRQLGVLTPR